VTPDPKNYTGSGRQNITNTTVLSGIIPGTDVTGITDLSTASGNAGPQTIINNGTILGGLNSGDYVVINTVIANNNANGSANNQVTPNTNPNGSGAVIVINKAPLTISGLIAANKNYDGNTLATVSGNMTLAGLLGSDVVSLIGNLNGGNFATANTGNNIGVNPDLTALLLSGADAANYYISGLTIPLQANIIAEPQANLLEPQIMPSITPQLAPKPIFNFVGIESPAAQIANNITVDNDQVIDRGRKYEELNCSSKDILFDIDSDVLRNEDKEFLKKCRFKEPLHIIGYTDSTGSINRNIQLSIDRANSVYLFMKANRALKLKPMISGMDIRDPKATNLTKEGRAENRRARILQN